MLRVNEEKLRETVQWQSVADIPNFPFRTFQELKKAITTGRYSFSVDATAALNLQSLTNTMTAMAFNTFLIWAPYLIGLACLVAAFVTSQYGLLLGLPIALVTIFFANPYNPLRNLMTMAGIGGVLVFTFLLFTDHPTGAGLVASFVFSFHATRAVRARMVLALQNAALESELFFMFLFARGVCLLRNNETAQVVSASA